MPPLDSKHMPPDPATNVIAQSQARIHQDIEGIKRLVLGIRRSIQAAREAIKRADAVVAQRLSEGR
jgi:hypothetical protein